LERAGWEILATNRRHVGYELDIVARKGTTVVVVEVKSRAKGPQSAADLDSLLSPRKRKALLRGAAAVAATRIDLAVVHLVNKREVVSYFVNVLEA
jgi:Holliday junction resolvase-like predicted endonuclease